MSMASGGWLAGNQRNDAPQDKEGSDLRRDAFGPTCYAGI